MVVRVSWRLPILAVLLTMAAALLPTEGFARATASGLRLGAHPDGITRLVLDLSESIDFSTALYADPYRVVVNTPAVAWSADNAVRKPYGSVQGLRYDEDGLGGRIMIDLKEPATVKSAFVIPPRDGQGWRFVMDLQSSTRAAFLSAAVPVRSAAKAEVKAEPKSDVRHEAKAEAKPESKPAARPDVARSDIARSDVARAVPLPEPRPEPATAAPGPVSEPAPAPGRSIVVYSPEAANPPPSVAPVPVAPPEPRPQGARTGKGGTPIMSAPVPPPLERPTAIPAAVAAPAPQPEPAGIAAPASAPVAAASVAPVAPAPVTPASVTPASITKVSAPQLVPDNPEPKTLPADGKPVIVIDPGHGGVDPGAIGVSGVYEKFITLAVARELKAQLDKGGKYKVYLTRDRDIFIRLRDRVAIARQYNADLFISLHADTVSNPQLKGLSVYTLSQNASDSEAQALADKENKADLIAGIDLSHESADVANILIDLAQRETMNRSAGFAGGVVDEVGRDANLLGNTHRFAGFAVLKAPDVPSVLVEMGYLSNEAEERNLRQPEHRTKLAKSISRAVDRFFTQGQKARRP